MNVAKVGQDVAYVAIAIHVCCKCVYLDVAYVSHICCKCFIWMLHMFSNGFSSVFSDVFCKCFRFMFQVFHLSSDIYCECFISMFQK
jgi:hypothetical protein